MKYSFRNTFLILVLCVSCTITTVAQTVIQGGVVTIGMNAVNNTVRFATLVQLPAGVEVKFTDRGWDNSTHAFTNLFTADGIVTWNVATSVDAGTILVLTLAGMGAATLSNEKTLQSYTSNLMVQGYSVTDPLGIAGDGLFVYQGDETNPYFISGFNNSSGAVDGEGWNTTVPLVFLRDSNLPSGTGSQNSLTNAVTAFGNPGPQLDNFQFTGSTTAASGNTWLTRLTQIAFWSGDDAGIVSPAVIQQLALLSALPVTLSSINAVRHSDDVVFTWSVADEINLETYEIEQSSNGRDFIVLARVLPQSGSGTKVYSWTHRNAFLSGRGNTLYYRLKMIDMDGETKYSRSLGITMSLSDKAQFRILSNPGNNNNISLTIQLPQQATVNFSLMDFSGKVVQQQSLQIAEGLSSIQIPFSSPLSKGLYLLTAMYKNERYIMKVLL